MTDLATDDLVKWINGQAEESRKRCVSLRKSSEKGASPEKKKRRRKKANKNIQVIEKPKVLPPFKAIPSFQCAALILSYAGSRENVKALLNLLTRNSGAYYKAHQF